MRILLVCPEVPHAGGMGRILWSLAEAGSKHSDWETYILTPVLEVNSEKVKEFDGYRKVDVPGSHCWLPERRRKLILDTLEYCKEKEFDIVYVPIELFDDESIGKIKNLVIGVHSLITQISNFDDGLPVTEQLNSIKSKRKIKKMLGELTNIKNIHLISDLEEKIWNKIFKEHSDYIVIPDMLNKLEYFGLPTKERLIDVVFCGRVTSRMKGSQMIQELLSRNPQLNFKIMATKGTKPIADRIFGEYPNCTIVSHVEQEDVLKEFGRSKVFCNPATYGAFDLTVIEAESQGCQIISSPCIGSTDYISGIINPTEYSIESFECAIRKALSSLIVPKTKLPTLEQEINNIFNELSSLNQKPFKLLD